MAERMVAPWVTSSAAVSLSPFVDVKSLEFVQTIVQTDQFVIKLSQSILCRSIFISEYSHQPVITLISVELSGHTKLVQEAAYVQHRGLHGLNILPPVPVL